DLQGAHLSRLEIANCRMTGAQLIETTLVDVTLTGCRLDFANLALARLDRVVFRDCRLEEASLDQAQLRDVRFESCDLRRATFGQSRHQRVQLHGCRLDGLRAISDLKGVAMPFPDIVDQAQAFAAALGIAVVIDPDNDA
ncbi:MAG TPA: pentapeptide repeat-containing protein, partial [Baekduia sp.]|nr:pentapeptide repeat-containing protein [Baekduia sp.]